MQDPFLVVTQISVRVAGRSIVDKVSFEARTGEVTAVIGPNGAGKTSLLEAISGLRSAEGTVLASGKTLSSFTERGRTFAYLPDQAELAAEATVRTLVEHAMACGKGVDHAELRRLLAIDALLDLGAGALSRGERQRVLLFCTLVQDRPIVLLDEPFNAFDPLQLRDVLSAVRSLAAGGTTVVASVHQLADAQKVADRVLLLADGQKVAFGTLTELRTEAGGADPSLEEIFTTLLARRIRET
jgi:ABC-type multidrug transport system ATPase subunit